MKVRPRSRTSTADDDFHERCDRRGQTMATSTEGFNPVVAKKSHAQEVDKFQVRFNAYLS